MSTDLFDSILCCTSGATAPENALALTLALAPAQARIVALSVADYTAAAAARCGAAAVAEATEMRARRQHTDAATRLRQRPHAEAVLVEAAIATALRDAVEMHQPSVVALNGDHPRLAAVAASLPCALLVARQARCPRTITALLDPGGDGPTLAVEEGRALSARLGLPLTIEPEGRLSTSAAASDELVVACLARPRRRNPLRRRTRRTALGAPHASLLLVPSSTSVQRAAKEGGAS